MIQITMSNRSQNLVRKMASKICSIYSIFDLIFTLDIVGVVKFESLLIYLSFLSG